MEETRGKSEEFPGGARDGNRKDELFTKVIRAGTRTYYMDVREIRDNSRYITITESKRKIDSSGNPFYMKHKIFLYQEDFGKFIDGLTEAMDFAENGDTATATPVKETVTVTQATPKETDSEFTDVNFDDLDDRQNG